MLEESTVNKLNKAATIIEAACYDAGVPIIIDSNGISALGNQCRFYARPARSSRDLGELKKRLKLNSIHYGKDAFRNLSTLRKSAADPIRAGLMLPRAAGFTIDISQGMVVFDFSLSDLVGSDVFAYLDISDLPYPEKNAIPMGVTLEGETVVFDPTHPNHCHALIAGITGSGKTVLSNTIIAGLVRAYTPDELKMFMSSGKPEDVRIWDGLPHLLAPPTYEPHKAFSMLKWVEEERRQRAEKVNGDKDGLPLIVVYIGEVSVLTDLNPTKFGDLLENLTRLGRSDRIMLICATQRPRGDQIGNIVAKSQIPLVICGKVQNPQDSYLALGKGSGGAETLPGRGSFITNNLVKFQAAFTCDDNKPDRAEQIINGYARKWDAEYVELPDDDIEATGTARDSEVHEVIAWFKQDTIEETSISHIMRNMNWGYPRASRVYEALEDMNVVSEERNDNRRAPVFLEKIE
jgi:DNA segregation ATPase FtsK/SpoIIIE-like protein